MAKLTSLISENADNKIQLYHGSPIKDLIDLDLGKNKTNGNQYGTAVYLTTDFNEAKQYAGSNGRVYNVSLDSRIKLLNLKSKLPDTVKSQVKQELTSSHNKDVYNSICRFNRDTYITDNKSDGFQFYKNKEKEWLDKDNTYFGNRPTVKKYNDIYLITYTSYDNIDKAINNMTGEDLFTSFSKNTDPEVFITIVTSSGYDGVITHNGIWYVIYKHIDYIHIVDKNITEGIHLIAHVKSLDDNSIKTIEDNDYNSKKSFADDLKANGYSIISINDNRDIYVSENSNYVKLSQLKKQMDFYKKMWDDSKQSDPDSVLFKDDYDKLKQIYDEAMKQSLTEYKKISNSTKSKLEEVSRNEMLATSKAQTITRYKKSAQYKGFTIYDIDTTSVLTTDCLRVTCKVGDYWDTVELQNILYWVQLYAEQQPNNQVNTRVVTKALMDAIDAMDIKVQCTCPDAQYRFNYKQSKLGAKYGKQETRPAKITNPHDYGFLCKHLIAMLSNKKWLQQVTGTFMDYIEDRIVEINRYLRVKPGQELTLPNELARYNAKKGFYTKLFKDQLDQDEEQDNTNDNTNNNVKDDNSSSNSTNNINK